MLGVGEEEGEEYNKKLGNFESNKNVLCFFWVSYFIIICFFKLIEGYIINSKG